MSGAQRLDWYRQGLLDQREGKALPFVIRLGEQLVGTTRFGDFMNNLPACEIGWTWLDRSQHGSGLNASIKYLILGNARLLMRHTSGARAEFSLAVMAYNLKRVMGVMGIAQMMEAMRMVKA